MMPSEHSRSELSPGDALRMAAGVARSRIRSPDLDAEDVASSALLDLLERHLPLCSDAIGSGVLRALRVQSSRARADRRLWQRLRREVAAEAPAAPAIQNDAEAPTGPAQRVLRDGTTIVRTAGWSTTEPEQLIVIRPDGVELRGSAAVEWQRGGAGAAAEQRTAGRRGTGPRRAPALGGRATVERRARAAARSGSVGQSGRPPERAARGTAARSRQTGSLACSCARMATRGDRALTPDVRLGTDRGLTQRVPVERQ
jgi:hypothetical protein